jgi:hypothetical protein
VSPIILLQKLSESRTLIRLTRSAFKEEESVLRLVNYFSISIDRSIYIWSRLNPYYGSYSNESIELLLIILSLINVYPRIE